MKKVTFVILFSTFLFSAFYAQEKKEMEYRSSSKGYKNLESKNEGADVPTNLAKAKSIYRKNTTGAIDLVQQALISAKFKSDTLGQARCYQLFGEIYRYKSQYPQAESNYLLAAQWFDAKRFYNDANDSYIHAAQNQVKQGKFLAAKALAERVLSRTKDKVLQTKSYEIIGEYHYQNGNEKEALQNFQIQQKLENELDPKSTSDYTFGSANANIAKVYASQKNLKQAATELNKSKVVSKKNDYLSDDSELKEEELFDKQEVAIENYSRNSSPKEELKLRGNIANSDMDNEVIKVQEQQLIGQALIESGDFKAAVQVLSNADKLTAKVSTNNAEIAAKTLSLLSEALSKSGDNVLALKTYQEYVGTQELALKQKEEELKLNAKLIAQQGVTDAIDKEFSLYMADNELTKKDKENIRKSLKIQRIVIFGLIFIVLGLIVAGYFIYKNAMEKRKANQLLALKSLRSQMNPHFIFNALNSVNSFIANNDERAANNFLSEFSQLMRMVLDNSYQDLIALKYEIEIIQIYLKLEQYRFRDKFDYQLEIAEDIDLEQFIIPPMLIQPFIENAVWHGLRYRESFGQLNVKLWKEQNQLMVEVSDNGIGRQKSKILKTKNQKQNTSKGLQNTVERIAFINQLYKTNLQLQVSDFQSDETHPGTKVILTIPQIAL